ncbi:MAG: lipopolysaccharide transport periplasmic protein LptA [Methylicorpusculum sp.]|uniref:lipopolysaccharide transport periplasmic protein LptA n=1 Tax=Methylicorpusculum sp. TaxID=2713644 RepID=UPI002726858D|nr:lipopolysaccharide transport periplasmic protein LptA [Methylicorpusculum sp.]MDO8842990.1 lipopolysaccharide transport periplasmic protein LptA [Methylicorpusculum sp.]MDO8940182.1 lipopolysaccharide transport periplasmic protein LptA [Methylicorpusculum sp.]MDP2202219.1 lipopolysaccharide transport periplasmic protein LptA [Methylicorpusculum sp.]
MNLRKNKGLFWGIWIAMAIYSPIGYSLKSDAEQPVYIDSNAASYDNNTEISTYTGNVISTQGSLEVKSDKLVVYFKNGNVDKLVATGNPARFKQQPDNGGEITGKALTGEYYPEQSLLILINEAVVWQDGNTYASDIIRYDSKNAIVKAGEQSSDSKRVRVILKPKGQ